MGSQTVRLRRRRWRPYHTEFANHMKSGSTRSRHRLPCRRSWLWSFGDTRDIPLAAEPPVFYEERDGNGFDAYSAHYSRCTGHPADTVIIITSPPPIIRLYHFLLSPSRRWLGRRELEMGGNWCGFSLPLPRSAWRIHRSWTIGGQRGCKLVPRHEKRGGDHPTKEALSFSIDSRRGY
jgi:hypothetical protein